MKRKPAPDALPTSIKVGFATYAIEDWHHGEAAGDGRYGETCHGSYTIRVTSAHGERKRAQTLLHEIMHAVCGSFAIDLENEGLKEEAWVKPMSLGLATVWRDNPAVFEWIAKHLTAP